MRDEVPARALEPCADPLSIKALQVISRTAAKPNFLPADIETLVDTWIASEILPGFHSDDQVDELNH